MKPITFIFKLIYNLVVCSFIAMAGAPLMGPAAFVLAGAMLIYSALPVKMYPDGALRNEVLSRLFSNDLQEKLFPNNTFFSSAQVDSGVAVNQESVEIPQDDGDAQVVINPDKYPLDTYTEEDKKKTYSPDLIATKPQLVTDLNQALTSYDKRAAKLRKHENRIRTEIADRIMHGWAPTKDEFIKQTTSANTRAAHAPGATGNRKRVADGDVLQFMSIMNDLDIPMEGRRMVAPAYMYEDLVELMKEQKKYNDAVNVIVEQGSIGVYYGFNIFLRSKTTIYTEAANPSKKAPDAASSGTDNQSIIFWHPSFVRYAEGNVKVYVNLEQGQYLGGTMNAAIRGGGTMSRLSELGVGALVEDNA